VNGREAHRSGPGLGGSLAAALLLGFATPALAAPGDLPNIVFILGDDVGFGDIGPYKLASSPIPTPNIDALARQGMMLMNANTSSSVCAPSRYSALTGNYTFRGRDKWGIWIYNYVSDLLPGQKTAGDVLRAAGYETAYVGKTHLGGDFYQKNSNQFYRGNDASQIDFTRQSRNGVIDHGFDYSYVLPNGVQNEPYAFFQDDKFLPLDPGRPDMVLLPAGTKGNSVVQTAGYGDANWDSSLAGPRLVQKAIDFIDRHYTQYGNQKPFFLYFSSEAIHEPNTPPASFFGFPVKGATGIDAKADMLYEFDLEVGQIVSALQQRGLANNTLFIVTSDNGGTNTPAHLRVGHDSVGGLRGRKTLIYQGGYRVPFIAKWGDGTAAGSRIKPGTRSSQLVMQQDWVSAIYHLTGQAIPADQALDSADILPILLGQQPDGVPVRDEMIIQAAHWGEQMKYRGIQMGDWVLVINAAGSPIELYNVANDPTQKTNLISDPAQGTRVTSMAARFDYVVNHSARTVPIDGAMPSLSINSVSVAESSGNAAFTVSLSAAATQVVTVEVATADGSAHAGSDYTPVSQTLTFSPGQTRKTVNVPILADSLAEGSETFSVTLSDPANAILGTRTGTGTITDAPSACGQPVVNTKTDRAAFLWEDCASNYWHLQFSAGGSYAVFTGTVTSTAQFSNVVGVGLEASDVLNFTSNPGVISFSMNLSSYSDEFDFVLPPAASACLKMTKPSNASVLLGAGRTPVRLPFNLRTLGPC
jgi:arylsulfatase A-like enzyme